MSGVLHHLTTPASRVQSLREALRLLKPGGHFLSYDPNAASPSMFLYRDPRSPLFSKVGKTDNEVLLSRGQIASELESAGFSAVSASGSGRHRLSIRRGIARPPAAAALQSCLRAADSLVPIREYYRNVCRRDCEEADDISIIPLT